jgi:hypothetical protein
MSLQTISYHLEPPPHLISLFLLHIPMCNSDHYILFVGHQLSVQSEIVKLITIHILTLALPAALGPGVYLASNRNEYQKHKINNDSGE